MESLAQLMNGDPGDTDGDRLRAGGGESSTSGPKPRMAEPCPGRLRRPIQRAAHRYGAGEADEPRWALTRSCAAIPTSTGWPDEHPRLVIAWLRGKGEPEMAQAVEARFDASAIPSLTVLDKALLACDELTGFVMACTSFAPMGSTRSLHRASRRSSRTRGSRPRSTATMSIKAGGWVPIWTSGSAGHRGSNRMPTNWA